MTSYTEYGQMVLIKKDPAEAILKVPKCEQRTKEPTIRYRGHSKCCFPAVVILDGTAMCVKHAQSYMFDTIFREQTHLFQRKPAGQGET